MASTFDIGDRFRVSAAFTSTAGAAMDPTQVKFHYKTPAGAVHSFTNSTASTSYSTGVKKASTGNFYYDITSTEAGYYAWRFSSTGNIIASEEGKTYIRNRMVST